MVKAPLVGPDIGFGEEILAALDAAKFPVTVALWLRGSDEDDWNLVISTPRYLDKDVYLQLVKAVNGVATGDLPIRLESNRHPMVKELRRIFGKTASVKGMRLGLHTIGGVFINDAYVYRIK